MSGEVVYNRERETMLEVSTVLAVIALVIFIFFWAGVLMIFGFSTRLPFLAKSRPTPRKTKLPEMYRNMRNCTINDVWIDGSGVPHKLSVFRRSVLWLKFHNPWSRVRRMIRRSGIGAREFRRGPVGAQKYDQCGRDLSGLRQTDWGPQAADPAIMGDMAPGDTYFNTVLNQVKSLNTSKTSWLSVTASGGNATLVVAAVNALHPERADYQCDGVDDQITIMAAINALPTGPADYLLGGGLGGKVLLLEGDYYVNATGAVDANQSAIYFTRGDVDLCGVGSGSRIHLNAGQNCSVIGCISGAGIPPVSIHDLYIDGNLTNNPGIPAILFSGGIRVAEPPAPAYYCQRVKIYNNYITNCRRLGIIARADDCQIYNNFVIDCNGDLIEGLGFQVDVHDNTCRSLNVRGNGAIGVDGAQYAIMKNNIVYANNGIGFMVGLYVMGGSQLVVVDGNQIIIGTAGTILNTPFWIQAGPERVICVNNIIWPDVAAPSSKIQASNVIMENNYFRGGSLEFNAAAATSAAPIELKRNRFEGTTLVYTAGTVHTDFWSTDFASTVSVTCGIQEAINALPATGGEVFIPAGTHTTKTPVFMKSKVSLKGAGASSIIKAIAAVSTNLTVQGNLGDDHVHVVNSAIFQVGMGIYIRDTAPGFGSFTPFAVVTSIVGDAVYFVGYTLDRNYLLANTPYAINAFPVISGKDGGVADYCNFESLSVDGNKANITGTYIRALGAITIYGNNNHITKCEVVNGCGDGIQVGGDYTSVETCDVHASNGIGVHIGADTTGFRMTDSSVFLNLDAGFFYCNPCYDSVLSGNTINRNGTTGISGIGPTDLRNVIIGNTVSWNGGVGIESDGGGVTNLSIVGNTIMNNSQITPNLYNIHLHGPVDMCIVTDNIIGDDQLPRTIDWQVVINGATGIFTNLILRDNIIFGTGSGLIFGPQYIMENRRSQSIQCFLARATNNVLAAAGNGAWPALAQPDAISGRNLEAQCFNGGGGGIGTVTVTGTTQFGAVVVATHTFAGAATFVLPEIFATINLNAVVLTGLAGGDTISVGYGNKIGTDHKGFVGYVKKVFKSGVGDITATAVEDAVYHGVMMPANIAPNEIYGIQSLDCLA